MRRGNETTVPGSEGQSTGRSGSVLSVRWVFPATDGPVSRARDERTVLGRGDDCATVLPGSEISRYHAELVRHGPVIALRDLDSRNGSFVNGRRVTEAPLDRGDVVRLGEWVGIVLELADNDAGAHGTIATGLFGGAALRTAVEPALRAAASDLPIILEGETGTGKEVMARAVHAASGRKGAFLAVNCAALPEQLAEAELFGYRRGAFTGAERASDGHFRAAQGGTLLLDEITELPAPLQAKVLRVLEQREVLPLGESQPVPIDVRVVAACQEPLDRAVADRRFRPDLYARLEGLTVKLPPLRARIDDVPYLFARLLHDLSGGNPPAVAPALVERLCLYDWPFNVRELVTLTRRLLVLHGQQPSLRVRHLPERFQDGAREPGEQGDSDTGGDAVGAAIDPAAGRPNKLDRDEQDLVRFLAALRAHNGNVSRAASASGISRQRCYRLMQARSDLEREGERT
jgi:transcriptional regulator with PAS, ATPase and Fis domain